LLIVDNATCVEPSPQDYKGTARWSRDRRLL